MQKSQSVNGNLIRFLLMAYLPCLIFLVAPRQTNAVDFVLKEANGVSHFRCVNSCGPVKVRKSGKCQYFVQSIYYHGNVKACEAEIAASKACGELEFDEPKNKELLNPACL